ncbi:putative leader peptide [Streptomyces sp. NPDC059605]
MVLHDVSDRTPGTLLVARLHVDLCRLSSAICTSRPPAADREV